MHTVGATKVRGHRGWVSSAYVELYRMPIAKYVDCIDECGDRVGKITVSAHVSHVSALGLANHT